MASKVTVHGRGFRFEWRFEGQRQKLTRPTVEEADQAKAYVERLGGQITDKDGRWIDGSWREEEAGQEAIAVVTERKRQARTFAAVAQEMIGSRFEEGQIVKHTVGIYERYLRMSLADLGWLDRDVAGFTHHDLNKLKAYLMRLRNDDGTKRYGLASVMGYVKFAMGVLFYAFGLGLIAESPTLKFKGLEKKVARERKRERAIERSDYAILLEAARLVDKDVKPGTLELMVQLMAATGLRIGEVLALTRSHVHLDDEVPWIDVQWQRDGSRGISAPKGKSAGKVEILLPELTEMLREHLLVARTVEDKLPNHESADWVFRTVTGKAMQYTGFYARQWKPLVKQAHALGFPADHAVSPHDLRHSCGSWLLNQGIDMFVVSRRLRHASIQVTVDVYGRPDLASRDKIRQVMQSVFWAA